MNTFSIGEAFTSGWRAFKKQPWTFSGALLIVFAVSGVMNAFQSHLDRSGFVGLLWFLVSLGVGVLLDMGLTAFMLKAYDTGTVSLADLWHPHPFKNYFGATFLSGFWIVLGLILFIVPGLIWGTMYMFVKLLVIDKGLTPVAALRESARLTRGNRWHLFGFILCVALADLIGAAFFFVGLLVALPVTTLAMIHVYRKLSATSSANVVQ